MGITAHALLKMCNIQSFVTNVKYDGWNYIINIIPLIKAQTISRVLESKHIKDLLEITFLEKTTSNLHKFASSDH